MYKCEDWITMTEIKNCQNQVIPAYSGITINITAPTLNAPALPNQACGVDYSAVGIDVAPEKNTQKYEYRDRYASVPEYRLDPNGYYSKAEVTQNMYNNEYNKPQTESTLPDTNTNNNIYLNQTSQKETPEITVYKEISEEKAANTTDDKSLSQTVQISQTSAEAEKASYPASYYINNYNNEYPQIVPQSLNQPAGSEDNNNSKAENTTYNVYNINQDNSTGNTDDTTSPYYINAFDKYMPKDAQRAAVQTAEAAVVYPADRQTLAKSPNVNSRYDSDAQEDLSVSQEIIQNIDEQNREEKELRKNGTKTKVVTLTNEYIMSLENYLNNPNVDIRLMAAKDILTRLDEDRNRYDDAALNALLNKMLQDPAKLVRIAALSALSSDLASGNEYTVELLNRIQQSGDADQQDVLEAAQIMLNRSATTEIRYIPSPENNINSTVTVENEHINRNKE